MKVNAARTPPNGWHFLTDGGMILEAHDKTTLIDRLFEYRLRNGQTTGTEENDIDNYFCSRWPSACNKEPADYGHQVPRSSNEPLLYRVSRWAAGLIERMPRGGYTLNPQPETARRAGICLSCPRNAPWKGKCGGCAGSTVALLNQVKKLQKATDGLRGCNLLGWENGTAGMLPFEQLPITEELRQQLPIHCWRK